MQSLVSRSSSTLMASETKHPTTMDSEMTIEQMTARLNELRDLYKLHQQQTHGNAAIGMSSTRDHAIMPHSSQSLTRKHEVIPDDVVAQATAAVALVAEAVRTLWCLLIASHFACLTRCCLTTF
eukprot:m.40095 g.40095  ORF g.40095 m.40095 type:complete len:124 (-) comp10398_c0_seq1:1477-1848(-)